MVYLNREKFSKMISNINYNLIVPPYINHLISRTFQIGWNFFSFIGHIEHFPLSLPYINRVILEKFFFEILGGIMFFLTKFAKSLYHLRLERFHIDFSMCPMCPNLTKITPKTP